MIPRVVHRIWCGSAPIPQRYEDFWSAWQRQLPNYQFVTWTDADVPRFSDAAEHVARTSSPAQKADILRYAILREEGGVYVDCDVMPFHWKDWDRHDGLVTCNENDGDEIRSIGFIAAPKGEEVFQRTLATIAAAQLGLRAVNEETGPVLFRACISQETRLPTSAFYPYSHDEPFSAVFERDLSQTCGIHVWGMSWLTAPALAAKARAMMYAGDIGAAEALARTVADHPQAHQILAQCERMRRARTAIFDAVLDGEFASAVEADFLCGWAPPRRPGGLGASVMPSFLDAGWHLLQMVPGAVVWQVGAADGIVADSLRPLLVNFDPVAVLIEPNPFLFARLKANYANNARLVFIEAAIGTQGGTGKLHAVVPDAVIAEGLPDWALGLSTFDATSNALSGKTVTPEMQERLLRATTTIDVDFITLDEVLARTGGRCPDMVVIDAEGMDAEIVAGVLALPKPPRMIMFEQMCLSQETIAQMRSRLPRDYVWADLGEDVALYRRDFLAELARRAYVEEGRARLLAPYRPDLLLPGYYPA